MEPSILTEETAEELAEVISPEQKPKTPDFKIGSAVIQPPSTSEATTPARVTIDEAGSSILSQGAAGVTILTIGDRTTAPSEDDESAKL